MNKIVLIRERNLDGLFVGFYFGGLESIRALDKAKVYQDMSEAQAEARRLSSIERGYDWTAVRITDI